MGHLQPLGHISTDDSYHPVRFKRWSWNNLPEIRNRLIITAFTRSVGDLNFIFPPVTSVWVCNLLRGENFSLSSLSTGGPQFKKIQGVSQWQHPWNGMMVIWIPVSISLSETIIIKIEQQNLKLDLGSLFGPCLKTLLASKTFLAHPFNLSDSLILCCPCRIKGALLTTRWLSSALVALHTSQACEQLCHWPENRLVHSASICWLWNMAILTVNLLGIIRKSLGTLQSSGTLDSLKKPRQRTSSQTFSSATVAVFLSMQNLKTLEDLLLFS